MFARTYTGADSKTQLEKNPLILRDLTCTVTTFDLDIGAFDEQPQQIATTDTYSLVGEVDLSTIYIKNHNAGSIGYLIVTGVIP